MKIVQNFVSAETAGTIASSAAASALAAYAKHLPLREVTIIGGACGLMTSVANSIFDNEGQTLFKIGVATAATFVALALIQSSVNPLEQRFGITLNIDSKMMSYITTASITGQIIYLALTTKPPALTPTRFDEMNDEAATKLHAQLVENPEKFDAYSPVLQSLVAARFDSLELDEVKPAPTFTTEVLEALSPEDVAYLFSYSVTKEGEKTPQTWTSWVEGETEKQALVARFVEGQFMSPELAKDSAFVEVLKTQELPKTVEDVTKLSEQDRAFLKDLLAQEASASYWAGLSVDIQWALIGPAPTKEALPALTINAETIAKAPKEAIVWIEANHNWLAFSAKDQTALKARFTELTI